MKPKPQLQYVNIPASSLAWGADFYLKLPFVADFIAFMDMMPFADGESFDEQANAYGGDSARYAFGVKLNDAGGPILIATPGPGVSRGVAVMAGTIEGIYVRPMKLTTTNPAIYGVTILVGKDFDFGSNGAVFN